MRRALVFVILLCAVMKSQCRKRRQRQSHEAAPVIVNKPLAQTGVKRGTVALVCNATGNPRPRVVYIKDNKELSIHRYSVHNYDYGEVVGSVLWVSPARIKDAAVYTCRATNRLGTVEASARIRLVEEDAIPSGFPHIDINPTVKTVEKPRPVLMECTVRGNPQPVVRWYKDYKPLYIDGTRITMETSGTLNILISNDTDSGKYHCAAENHFGTIFSEGANIYVRVRRVTPRFSIPPKKSYDVLENDNLNITCVSYGSPMPVVKWQKETPDGPVHVWPADSSTRKVGRLILPLREVKESSNYTCVATSIINTIKFTTEVRVKALPKPPVDISSSPQENSPYSIRLTWRSGDPEPILTYILYYRRHESSNTYDFLTDISTTSFTISGLEPHTSYELRIAATNAQGEGNMSEPFFVKTSEAMPGSAPNIASAYLYGTNTIIVTWKIPAYPNGIVTSYKVYYTSTPALPVTEWQIYETSNGQTRVASVRDLTPHVTYSVRMSAVNSAGEGPKSEAAKVKTEQGVPAQPRNFRGVAESTKSIRLQWEQPNNGGSSSYEITSYVMFYNCTGSLCSSKGKQITFEPTKEFALLNLQPNTVYHIRLAAQSAYGEGVMTPTIAVSTKPDVPSASPQNVVAIPVNENSILVRWNPPPKENQNGALIDFTVYYNANGVDGGSSLQRAGPNATSWIVRGLAPFTTYDVLVSASTAVGEGPRSRVVGVTTLESKPDEAPSNVVVEAINSSSARVRWSPLGRQHRNGYLRGYQIAYSDDRNDRNKIVNSYGGSSTGLNNQLLEHIITGLQPKTRYAVSVAAFTLSGSGPGSTAKYVTTKGEVPSPPSFSLEKLQNGKLAMSWTAPERQNGELVGYVLKYRCVDWPSEAEASSLPWSIRRFDATDSRYELDDIVPGWSYIFKLAASNSEGVGTEVVENFLSKPELPIDAPRDLSGETVYLGEVSSSSDTQYAIKLTWSELSQGMSNGPISSYILYYLRPTSTSVRLISNKTSYLFSPVVRNEKHEFQVSALNSAGEGPKSPSVTITVADNLPINPSVIVLNFAVKESSSTSVWLEWKSPSQITQPRFVITYRVTSQTLTRRIETNQMETAIGGLTTGKSYNFTITMRGQYLGRSMQFGSTSIVARTTSNLLSHQPTLRNITQQGAVEIVLLQATNAVNIKSYLVVVVPLISSRGLDMPSPDSFSQSELIENSHKLGSRRHEREISQPSTYISAELEAIPVRKVFILGDGRSYGKYHNKHLDQGQDYLVFIRAMLKDKAISFTSSPFSEVIRIPGSEDTPISTDGSPPHEEAIKSDNMWTIGPIVAGVVLIALVITVICVKRKRGKSAPKAKYSAPVAKLASSNKRLEHDPVELRRQNCQTPGMLSHPPIPLSEMAFHVERLRANDNLKFSQEYDSIDPGQQFMWEHSALPVNQSKNRYANVIAYDHSRLTLSPIEGVPGSDYINANYISGYRRQHAYIATQGPTRETTPDFWRMVWEQKSTLIVMMTKCEERSKVKCDQYWPMVGVESYGMVSVTLVDEMELATYCVRTFSMCKAGCDDRRELKHFQFTAWPDHGVPDNPTPVLNFMRRVKSHYSTIAGPVVVHCSAGVGRAGCFICIDAMLERMEKESSIDIYGQVTCMRAERNYMVQTEDQYIFIHDALLEAINCGNTELPAGDLYNHLHRLTTAEGENAVTGMEMEFKRLASQKASASRFVSANLTCNKFKNRLVNILPYESTRVCLQPIRGVEGSDYINASFIDGYREKRAYIATQGPLAETVDEFWRMLWEHNTTIVVMLTKLREHSRDKCHQYWPVERSARYQYFVVDPMSEYVMEQYILREFKVTDARDGQLRTIRQFQFTDWPEQGVPKSGEGFINFIGQVHKTKEQFGQEGPITIHCSAGVGRTGVFITLSIALERMRYENLVDMFQTVKMLRTQRPAMVQTEDQYQFCYRAALEYLGSFDHYTTSTGAALR